MTSVYLVYNLEISFACSFASLYNIGFYCSEHCNAVAMYVCKDNASRSWFVRMYECLGKTV